MSPGASRRGARRGRLNICAVSLLLASASACAADTHPAATPAAVLTTPSDRPPAARDSAACRRQAPAAWPVTPVARRTEIRRLTPLRSACIDSPVFLAVLGGLLLEDGEPEEARLLLERSLLLDPEALGAQADHALALSALGEPVALRELASLWRGRSDLPPALRSKLYPPSRDSLFALPVVSLGLPERRRLGAQADASLAFGYETNLDRSPRLTELTLTVPEGPVVLPVVSRPRAGFAALGTASGQVGYAPWDATVLRTGLNLNARAAVQGDHDKRSTDWQQLQWATEALQRGAGWLAEASVTAAWIGGALSEPYRVLRFGAAGELLASTCRTRLALLHERRVQSVTEALNGTAQVWAADLVCPLPGVRTWNVSLSVSDGRDRPASAERPGGEQRLRGGGLRLAGLFGAETRIDLSWRVTRTTDQTGYSVLLEDNARRRSTLHIGSMQLLHTLDGWGLPGLSATLQWQVARQSSNLELFAYRADSLYAGLRWAW